MSLIDPSYFINEIALPADKYNPLSTIIDRYENLIITDLFGYELGKEVIAYDVGTSPQRIKDIVEGKEYSISGSNCGSINPSGNDILIKWDGLINSGKKSLIAYWCYWKWCKENDHFATNSGGAKAKLENAKNVGFARKATDSYRFMLELYGRDTDPVNAPSCYNFMYEFRDVYPEWVFEIKKPVNIFGI